MFAVFIGRYRYDGGHLVLRDTVQLCYFARSIDILWPNPIFKYAQNLHQAIIVCVITYEKAFANYVNYERNTGIERHDNRICI